MIAQSPVWITGIGTCTPLGNTLQSIGSHLLSGRSAIQKIASFSVKDHPSQIAGQILEVPCPEGEDPEKFYLLERLEQLVRFCCRRALSDAGLYHNRQDLRVGIVMGIGAEWLLFWEHDGLRQDPQLWNPPAPVSSLLQRTRNALQVSGPAVSVSAACASGNVAFDLARSWLQQGWVDVCLAGGCDMGVSPVSLASFGNLRALSRRNDEPLRASRPFDRDRDGFVMSEGGAVFVLEKADTARRRSAQVYAEVAGYGASSDGYHMVIPNPDPAQAIQAMHTALKDAAITPDEVDYVNAHATSTPVGDCAEARVLASVFGDKVSQVPISSTKSITGHLLTAAAAVEALACIVAMRESHIPPTINLDEVDPKCAFLCHVPHTARAQKVRVAVSNSFGFGGSNTSLVLRAA